MVLHIHVDKVFDKMFHRIYIGKNHGILAYMNPWNIVWVEHLVVKNPKSGQLQYSRADGGGP